MVDSVSRRITVGRSLFRAATALLACLASSCTVAPQAALTSAAPDNSPRVFDAIVDDVVARYGLPGLALGIVVDGKVIYSRTTGEVVAGSGRQVTPDTLFKIASNSKAMTTAVLARLVDARKLRWDDPVTRHLPAFRMYDPWVTREMQVRDLLIHNSGLREGAGDLMLWPEPNLFTRADVVAGLAHLRPLHSFRSRYAYDNLMYIVAGEVAAAASGMSYETLVHRELFEPLGMDRCQAGAFERDVVGDVAQPHRQTAEGNTVVRADPEVVPVSVVAAAGGIRCSLNDLLKWIQMWLHPENRSSEGGERWISIEQRKALWAPHMPLPLSQRQRDWDGSRFNAYGYGWRVSDVDGKLRVAHTGTLMGMYSAVVLIPELRTGYVFMINGNGASARTVLSTVLTRHFTAPGAVPSVAYHAEALERDQVRSGEIGRPPPARVPAPSVDLQQWFGTYRDAWFGEVFLCSNGERVTFRSAKSPLLSGTVMQSGADRLVDWSDESVDAEAWLHFSTETSATGSVRALDLSKVDPQADFSYDYEDLHFTRTGDCPVDAPARIDRLMGVYAGDVPGASVLVLKNGEPVFRRSYGLADLEEKIAASPATNYRLASVTKQFTAAAILLLAEEGRLGLDDRARKWLPTLPPQADAVTVRQLLTHTSGLVDYEDVIPGGMSAQLHDADVLSLLETQHRTYFPPGTSYRYSNSGYALLALIVERAAAQRFAAFLQQRIFLPLGMRNTVAHEEGRSVIAERAFGYSQEAGSWVRTDQSQTSAVLGDGGIYSSIDDLAKWDAALYDERLLQAASLRQAFEPATDTDDATVRYGFGWRITGDSLWHSGETRGFRSVIVRFPHRHLSVLVLTNRNDPEPYRTALAIAEYF
jgi:CubicO group peptidase (beta-lactamase class C family)